MIEEHLTDNYSEFQYRPAFSGGKLLEKWKVTDSYRVPEDGFSYVCKRQKFTNGGAEYTVRHQNMHKLAAAVAGYRRIGKRTKPDEPQQSNIQIAANRAKRQCRYIIKDMGATNMLTLSRREGPATQGQTKINGKKSKWFWNESQWADWENGGREAYEAEHGQFKTEEDWAKDFDKFRRLLTRVDGKFEYLLVLEKHRKGNYHAHVAWVGKVKLDIVRRCWHVVIGGKDCGNIDSAYRPYKSKHEKASRIASYMTKYMAKGFERSDRFNKKRYWSSRRKLPAAEHFVLEAENLDQAREQAFELFGLSMMDYLKIDPVRGMVLKEFFPFPDGGGCWFSFIPGIHSGAPPPF